MRKILDASSIINTRSIPPGASFITSPGVIGELKDTWSHFRMLSLIESKKMTIIRPEDQFVRKVIGAVEELGSKISDVDIEVLALGLQVKQGIIITDDLEMQNLAKQLNIPYHAATNHKISVQLHWIAVCPGCNRRYTDVEDFDRMTCDHCGSRLKKRAHKLGRKHSAKKSEVTTGH